VPAPPPAPRTPGKSEPLDPFASLEMETGGRLGVAALDLGTGAEIGHRPDDRFAMCSTFKWILAAAILAASDAGELSLSRDVAFGEKDLLEYAPTTRASLAAGRLTVEALARAIVVNSDNTAANLLLPLIGGPAGLTAFVRKHGDSVTRFDRDEPTLNTNLPDDPRDTSTPSAMANLMKTILVGERALSQESRKRLLDWLVACETGRERLRAGLPADWITGDKTGTGERSAINDVAITMPPGRAPLIVVAFLSDSGKSPAELSPSHAAIARAVVEWAKAS
ncbi:MAG: class A beta-lactamase, partial [Myxococcales bacterium]|nr:class A beta-lactamase [Myxococcales bacterium]